MSSSPNQPPFQVRGLGELAIRCAQLDPMVAFYRDVIGLEILAGNESSDIVFFRIADGVAGHTTVLALFRDDAGGADGPLAAGPRSSLHHLALSLPWQEQQQVMEWYDQLGIDYVVRDFDWIGWRGIFTRDPEGNHVELVAGVPGHNK